MAHPGKKPMGHPETIGIWRLPVKDRSSKQQRATLPQEILTQPTEFEESGVLQHPLASGDPRSIANSSFPQRHVPGDCARALAPSVASPVRRPISGFSAPLTFVPQHAPSIKNAHRECEQKQGVVRAFQEHEHPPSSRLNHAQFLTFLSRGSSNHLRNARNPQRFQRPYQRDTLRLRTEFALFGREPNVLALTKLLRGHSMLSLS